MPIVTVELGVTDMRYATKALAITSHVRPVVNSRLLAITRSKLWRMGKALSRKVLLKESRFSTDGNQIVGMLS